MKIAIGAALAAMATVGGLLIEGSGENGEVVALQAPFIPAFPGARGWAANSMQDCRELPPAVHFVDNMNQDGPGSFRAALEANTEGAYDFVIFRTGGRLWLQAQQNLVINDMNCMYVAGQTAPGGGVTQTGNILAIRGPGPVDVDNSAGGNFLLRYFTLRKHRFSTWALTPVILDHISCAWSGNSGTGGEDCMSLGIRPNAPGELNAMPWVPALSNSLVFELHEDHPTACVIRGHRWTAYRNALMGPGHRICLVQNNLDNSGGEFMNNLIYNWSTGSGGSTVTRNNFVDFIRNYHKRGPATNITTPWRKLSFHWRAICPEDPGLCESGSYFEGNRNFENNYAFGTPLDSVWRGPERQYVCHPANLGEFNPDCVSEGGDVPEVYRRDVPLADYLGVEPEWPYVPRIMTDGLRDDILATVGNYRGLACDGTWVPRRDSMDTNAINNFRNGTGRNAPVDFIGSGIPGASPDPNEPGWVVPTPDAGTPCTDTSGDGIPDEWYTRWGFDPVSPPPIDSTTISGYWLIEHYLNGSDPNDPVPWLTEEATYADLRSVYGRPMVLDSVRQGTGWRYFRWPQDVPRTGIGFVVAGLSPPADSALVLTYDVIPAVQHADSASVDAFCVSWNLYDGDLAACRTAMRTQFVPGAP